ncbi:uncharacterized protein B0H18DRAFT_436758 [Fomitopsis serialis]|uniref:uncharacterized protein n=1 Tax=Fomitopsis serialis TaxID=139415 RepID=UPI0020077308|nr:uncharacterized protein B0H18DRAFT_436758 [Neoantrodia serialis]KAH9924144.1 hypothetical protein B0H18DRAFT_436758 [Neoantrodia serialis]
MGKLWDVLSRRRGRCTHRGSQRIARSRHSPYSAATVFWSRDPTTFACTSPPVTRPSRRAGCSAAFAQHAPTPSTSVTQLKHATSITAQDLLLRDIPPRAGCPFYTQEHASCISSHLLASAH